MGHPATELLQDAVHQEIGAVVAAEGARVVVRTASDRITATRATSCLVEPCVDDFVLVAVTGGGNYVLAVLEREAGAGARLVADGDLEVRLEQGRFTVAAKQGVRLLSTEAISMVARALDVNALDGTVVMQRLSVLGTYVQAELSRAKVFAQSLDTTVDRLSERVKRSFRWIAEVDQVRAERMDYVAKKEVSLRGKNALVTAETLVKVDGEQIHMG